MKSVFYVRDGLKVQRDDNGDVLITFLEGKPQEHRVSLPINEFASMIAFLTPQGDNAQTFARAVRFLTTGSFKPQADWDYRAVWKTPA